MSKKKPEPASAVPAVLNELEEPILEEDSPAEPPLRLAPIVRELHLPLREIPAGVYLQRHVEVQLDEAERLTLRQALEGLRSIHATLPNGRHVESGSDVLHYILAGFGGRLTA